LSKPISEEIRDIHHRIDTIHTETNNQYGTITERLHAIELRLSDRPRFPNWLPASLTVIGIFLVGQTIGAVWWASSINQQVQSVTFVREACCVDVPVMKEQIKKLDERVVGKSQEGWHRLDHDQYNKYIEERFKRIEETINRLNGTSP
jgi:hypothetical protein